MKKRKDFHKYFKIMNESINSDFDHSANITSTFPLHIDLSQNSLFDRHKIKKNNEKVTYLDYNRNVSTQSNEENNQIKNDHTQFFENSCKMNLIIKRQKECKLMKSTPSIYIEDNNNETHKLSNYIINSRSSDNYRMINGKFLEKYFQHEPQETTMLYSKKRKIQINENSKKQESFKKNKFQDYDPEKKINHYNVNHQPEKIFHISSSPFLKKTNASGNLGKTSNPYRNNKIQKYIFLENYNEFSQNDNTFEIEINKAETFDKVNSHNINGGYYPKNFEYIKGGKIDFWNKFHKENSDKPYCYDSNLSKIILLQRIIKYYLNRKRHFNIIHYFVVILQKRFRGFVLRKKLYLLLTSLFKANQMLDCLWLTLTKNYLKKCFEHWKNLDNCLHKFLILQYYIRKYSRKSIKNKQTIEQFSKLFRYIRKIVLYQNFYFLKYVVLSQINKKQIKLMKHFNQISDNALGKLKLLFFKNWKKQIIIKKKLRYLISYHFKKWKMTSSENPFVDELNQEKKAEFSGANLLNINKQQSIGQEPRIKLKDFQLDKLKQSNVVLGSLKLSSPIHINILPSNTKELKQDHSISLKIPSLLPSKCQEKMNACFFWMNNQRNKIMIETFKMILNYQNPQYPKSNYLLEIVEKNQKKIKAKFILKWKKITRLKKVIIFINILKGKIYLELKMYIFHRFSSFIKLNEFRTDKIKHLVRNQLFKIQMNKLEKKKQILLLFYQIWRKWKENVLEIIRLKFLKNNKLHFCIIKRSYLEKIILSTRFYRLKQYTLTQKHNDFCKTKRLITELQKYTLRSIINYKKNCIRKLIIIAKYIKKKFNLIKIKLKMLLKKWENTVQISIRVQTQLIMKIIQIKLSKLIMCKRYFYFIWKKYSKMNVLLKRSRDLLMEKLSSIILLNKKNMFTIFSFKAINNKLGNYRNNNSLTIIKILLNTKEFNNKMICFNKIRQASIEKKFDIQLSTHIREWNSVINSYNKSVDILKSNYSKKLEKSINLSFLEGQKEAAKNKKVELLKSTKMDTILENNFTLNLVKSNKSLKIFILQKCRIDNHLLKAALFKWKTNYAKLETFYVIRENEVSLLCSNEIGVYKILERLQKSIIKQGKIKFFDHLYSNLKLKKMLFSQNKKNFSLGLKILQFTLLKFKKSYIFSLLKGKVNHEHFLSYRKKSLLIILKTLQTHLLNILEKYFFRLCKRNLEVKFFKLKYLILSKRCLYFVKHKEKKYMRFYLRRLQSYSTHLKIFLQTLCKVILRKQKNDFLIAFRLLLSHKLSSSQQVKLRAIIFRFLISVFNKREFGVKSSIFKFISLKSKKQKLICNLNKKLSKIYIFRKFIRICKNRFKRNSLLDFILDKLNKAKFKTQFGIWRNINVKLRTVRDKFYFSFNNILKRMNLLNKSRYFYFLKGLKCIAKFSIENSNFQFTTQDINMNIVYSNSVLSFNVIPPKVNNREIEENFYLKLFHNSSNNVAFTQIIRKRALLIKLLTNFKCYTFYRIKVILYQKLKMWKNYTAFYKNYRCNILKFSCILSRYSNNRSFKVIINSVFEKTWRREKLMKMLFNRNHHKEFKLIFRYFNKLKNYKSNSTNGLSSFFLSILNDKFKSLNDSLIIKCESNILLPKKYISNLMFSNPINKSFNSEKSSDIHNFIFRGYKYKYIIVNVLRKLIFLRNSQLCQNFKKWKRSIENKKQFEKIFSSIYKNTNLKSFYWVIIKLLNAKLKCTRIKRLINIKEKIQKDSNLHRCKLFFLFLTRKHNKIKLFNKFLLIINHKNILSKIKILNRLKSNIFHIQHERKNNIYSMLFNKYDRKLMKAKFLLRLLRIIKRLHAQSKTDNRIERITDMSLNNNSYIAVKNNSIKFYEKIIKYYQLFELLDNLLYYNKRFYFNNFKSNIFIKDKLLSVLTIIYKRQLKQCISKFYRISKLLRIMAIYTKSIILTNFESWCKYHKYISTIKMRLCKFLSNRKEQKQTKRYYFFKLKWLLLYSRYQQILLIYKIKIDKLSKRLIIRQKLNIWNAYAFKIKSYISYIQIVRKIFSVKDVFGTLKVYGFTINLRKIICSLKAKKLFKFLSRWRIIHYNLLRINFSKGMIVLRILKFHNYKILHRVFIHYFTKTISKNWQPHKNIEFEMVVDCSTRKEKIFQKIILKTNKLRLLKYFYLWRIILSNRLIGKLNIYEREQPDDIMKNIVFIKKTKILEIKRYYYNFWKNRITFLSINKQLTILLLSKIISRKLIFILSINFRKFYFWKIQSCKTIKINCTNKIVSERFPFTFSKRLNYQLNESYVYEPQQQKLDMLINVCLCIYYRILGRKCLYNWKHYSIIIKKNHILGGIKIKTFLKQTNFKTIIKFFDRYKQYTIPIYHNSNLCIINCENFSNFSKDNQIHTKSSGLLIHENTLNDQNSHLPAQHEKETCCIVSHRMKKKFLPYMAFIEKRKEYLKNWLNKECGGEEIKSDINNRIRRRGLILKNWLNKDIARIFFRWHLISQQHEFDITNKDLYMQEIKRIKTYIHLKQINKKSDVIIPTNRKSKSQNLYSNKIKLLINDGVIDSKFRRNNSVKEIKSSSERPNMAQQDAKISQNCTNMNSLMFDKNQSANIESSYDSDLKQYKTKTKICESIISPNNRIRMKLKNAHINLNSISCSSASNDCTPNSIEFESNQISNNKNILSIISHSPIKSKTVKISKKEIAERLKNKDSFLVLKQKLEIEKNELNFENKFKKDSENQLTVVDESSELNEKGRNIFSPRENMIDMYNQDENSIFRKLFIQEEVKNLNIGIIRIKVLHYIVKNFNYFNKCLSKWIRLMRMEQNNEDYLMNIPHFKLTEENFLFLRMNRMIIHLGLVKTLADPLNYFFAFWKHLLKIECSNKHHRKDKKDLFLKSMQSKSSSNIIMKAYLSIEHENLNSFIDQNYTNNKSKSVNLENIKLSSKNKFSQSLLENDLNQINKECFDSNNEEDDIKINLSLLDIEDHCHILSKSFYTNKERETNFSLDKKNEIRNRSFSLFKLNKLKFESDNNDNHSKSLLLSHSHNSTIMDVEMSCFEKNSLISMKKYIFYNSLEYSFYQWKKEIHNHLKFNENKRIKNYFKFKPRAPARKQSFAHKFSAKEINLRATFITNTIILIYLKKGLMFLTQMIDLNKKLKNKKESLFSTPKKNLKKTSILAKKNIKKISFVESTKNSLDKNKPKGKYSIAHSEVKGSKNKNSLISQGKKITKLK